MRPSLRKSVFIRVDASVQIGTGHWMRCMVLAQELFRNNCRVDFISRGLDRSLANLAEKKGFCVHRLEGRTVSPSWFSDCRDTEKILSAEKTPVDCLVVDSYAIDDRWESRLRPYARKLMAIDDLANRRHDSDILMDQNYYPSPSDSYAKLVPRSCRRFVGPEHALLRPEFYRVRLQFKRHQGAVRRLLVSFGGSDRLNETEKVLKILKPLCLKSRISVDVVVGLLNPHRQSVRRFCASTPNFSFHCPAKNMAILMARADLAVASGGIAALERCYLGLPTLATAIADNQVRQLQSLEKAGALKYAGKSDEIRLEGLAESIENLCDALERRIQMSQSGMRLMGKRNGKNRQELIAAMLTPSCN